MAKFMSGVEERRQSRSPTEEVISAIPPVLMSASSTKTFNLSKHEGPLKRILHITNHQSCFPPSQQGNTHLMCFELKSTTQQDCTTSQRLPGLFSRQSYKKKNAPQKIRTDEDFGAAVGS